MTANTQKSCAVCGNACSTKSAVPASGCFYQVRKWMFLPSGCRCSWYRPVHDVSCRIQLLPIYLPEKDRFVRFPFTVAAKNENKLKFYQMGGFPSCIYCVLMVSM